ncbi:hypothetical protein E3N88_44760 [Mikania micrantha]|uniref:Cytochrome P450 n=1 Tax=Mikania micrantha TaxID=192012 RepID=A0A5N6LB34_9ASTR|nr:hypothetical protein E3N88_44760 [Mikania micrantha]
MEITTVSCVLGVVAMLLFYMSWKISNWLWFKPKKMEKFLRDQGLKGTPYRFMYGDLKEMGQMLKESMSKPMNLNHDIVPRVMPFFHKFITTFGKNYFTWVGTKPLIVIQEPSMIRDILVNHTIFQKQKVNPLTKWLVRGLLEVEGDQWAKHRKIVNPAFHMEKLKHMVPKFSVSSCDLIEKWEKLLNTENKCEVDVWPYIHSFTGDIISRTAFGSSFEEGKRIFELQDELGKLIVKALMSIYIPGSRFLPTKNNKRIKQMSREVNRSIKKIIDRRLVALKAGEDGHGDLLGILLDSNYNEIKQNVSSHSGLSIDDIIEECKVFYLAGKESTANAIVWTLILLAQHSEWQTRAREEVLHVFGDKNPDYERLSHLKVIQMILNESLRLYPPALHIKREIQEETKLGNLILPAGCYVQVSTLILHHDKDLWGEDAHEFKPERFSEGISKITKGQFMYVPFSGGPRICIGLNFALLEAKIAIAAILQHFSFELSPSYAHAPCPMLTLQPQFGAHLSLKKL